MRPNYAHLQVPHILPSFLPCHPPQKKTNQSKQGSEQKQKQTTNTPKQDPQKQKNLCFSFFSGSFNTTAFILVAVEASVCQIVYLFVPSVSLAKVHCHEPLVSGTPSLLDPDRSSSGISCGCLEKWRSYRYHSTEPVSL